jgi:hypothetical protein
MNDKEDRKPAATDRKAGDNESKGQYGGLKSLGPGGGRDIEEATETEDVNTDRNQTRRR